MAYGNHMEDALHTAEAANRAKSQFLSNMSHDIRTPMNAIVGFSQIMLRHYNNPDKVRNYSEKIVVSSQHLLSLINDVLDMSKIESGKTTLNLCDVNLADIINETDNIIRPQAKKKNQTFVVKSDGVEYCCITADKLRLSQKYGVEMPIVSVVNRLLFEDLNAEEGMKMLLTRNRTSESTRLAWDNEQA